MARYIDADKAKHEFNIGFGGVSHAVIANQIIDSVPTADVVEVVRCKDCKKFIEKGDEFLLNDVYGFCEKSRIGFFDDGEEVYGNGFCSDGERK